MGFFNGVEPAKGGSGIEPGVYTARIREPRTFTANSGSAGIEVTFEDEGGKGSVRDSLYFTAKAAPYVRYKLEAAGAPIPDDLEPGEGNPSFEKLAKSLDGCRVKIRVGMEPDREDSSKEWPRVKEWEKPDGKADGISGGSKSDDGIPF